MIDRQLLQDLDAAAGKLHEAEESFIEICRRIAGDERAETVAIETVTQMAPSRGGGRRRSSNPKKVRFMAGMKIKCAQCGLVVEGAKEKSGQKYPYQHMDRSTGHVCKGSKLVGVPIGAENRLSPNPGQ